LNVCSGLSGSLELKSLREECSFMEKNEQDDENEPCLEAEIDIIEKKKFTKWYKFWEW
jgi:hypothetical protein